MYTKTNRLPALLLTLSMMLTLYPAPALADGAELPMNTVSIDAEDSDASVVSEETQQLEPASEETSEKNNEDSAIASQKEEPSAPALTEVPEEPHEYSAVPEEAIPPEPAPTAVPQEESTAPAEWKTVTNPTQISTLIEDAWSDDYFQEAVIDPSCNLVTVDGERASVADIFGAEAASADILDSVSAAEDYFEETPYEAEIQSNGTVTVTAPYQTMRIVVSTPSLDEDYGAKTILNNPDLGEYILQFSTEEATQAAYAALCARYGETSCYVDQVIGADDVLFTADCDDSCTVDNGSSTYSWGADYTGLSQLKGQADGAALPTVTVAILDTGIDADNWFFTGRIISPDSRDMVTGSSQLVDSGGIATGHGTHVAGIITDCTASNVELLVLRVFNDNGNSSWTLVSSAIQYALDCGADIINLSLGDSTTTAYIQDPLSSALTTACNAGVPMICAAGNSAGSIADRTYPACSPQTISVSALSQDSTFASGYSSYGETVDFCAPGTSILSANNGGSDGSLTTKSGTSMAAPHIAAALAWMKAQHPDFSVPQLYNLLKSYAVDLGTAGRDEYFGWGCPVLDLSQRSAVLEYDCTFWYQTPCTPAVSISGLTEGQDFTVSYKDNNAPGTATAIITGTGSRTGSIVKTFQITNDISVLDASLEYDSIPYSSAAAPFTPAVTIEGLTLGQDFAVSYKDNLYPGTASVTIEGIGAYTGTITVRFTIEQLDSPVLSAVSNTASGPRLTWTEVNGAEKYRVFLRSGSSWVKLADTTSTNYTYLGAVSGTTYQFTVRCVSSDGSAFTSSYDTAGLSLLYLSQPGDSMPSSAEKDVSVNGNKFAGCSICHKPGLFPTFQKTTDVSSGSTVSHTNTPASSGSTYYDTFDSAISSHVAGTPPYYLAVPSVNLINTAGGITVKWDKITGALGYYIYRKTSPSSTFQKIAVVSSGSTVTYTDTSVSSSSACYYTVYAYYGSAMGSYVTGLTPHYLAEPSVNLTAAGSGVTVKWNKIAGARGYYIYRKTSLSPIFQKIATVSGGSAISYTDTAVKPQNSSACYYTVRTY